VRRAAFLDRDGTLIEDAHYLADPDRVVLLPGAADAVRRLTEAGWLAIVITNQSGIARGLVSEAQFAAVTRRLDELLAREGARLDATYHCPHLPEISGACDCRKPGVELHRRAAREHDIDLAASLYVGDRWRDVEPALRLGGHGVLVPALATPPDETERARREATVATSLAEVVDRALDANYLPDR
jgi:histidinol-phosphate phosphatase family protein